MTLKDVLIADALLGSHGGGGGEYPYEYHLGGYFTDNRYDLEVFHNHVKYTGKNTGSNDLVLGLRNLPTVNSQPEWFNFTAGSVVEVTYKNIVNNSGIVWNANARKANSYQSANFGIGNGTHNDGNPIVKTVTIEEDLSIGSWFLYIAQTQPDTLEFDIEITVDGVRIL